MICISREAVCGERTRTIQGGRFHDLSKDPNRKLCRLHIALMDRMGVHTSHFGDAENALAI